MSGFGYLAVAKRSGSELITVRMSRMTIPGQNTGACRRSS